MTRFLYALGKFAVRRRRWVVPIWLLVAIGISVGASAAGVVTNDDVSLPGYESQVASDLLSEKFPSQANGSVPVSFRAPQGKKVTDFQPQVEQVVKRYSNDSLVSSAVSPFDPEGAAQIGKQERVAYISLVLGPAPGDLTRSEARHLQDQADPLEDAGLEVAVGGYVGELLSSPDTDSSAGIGMLAAIVILLFTFGTVVAMGMPILTAISALLIGISGLTLLGHLVNMPSTGAALATMIGLGVGIDYGLFIVTRHRQQLDQGMEMNESIARSVASAGGAVLFAGGTVIIALLSLGVAQIPIVTTLGYSSAIVVAVAVISALLFLPALLAMLGHRINSLPVPGISGGGQGSSARWARWGEQVTGRPVPWLIGSILVLAVLAYPALNMTLGQPNDGALPQDTTMRKSYDQLQEGFGAGANGPILVTVELGKAATGPSDPRLTKLDRDLAQAKGVASASPPVLNQAGNAAIITVQPTTSPSSEATADLVKRLRESVVPKATQNQDMRVDVGGYTAGYIDLADAISSKLPMVIGVVLLLSFLLLTMAFRSLLVPLKAVLMNLISIAAAFGVVTFIFDHAWTRNLIGIDNPEPIVSYVPLMMFAILFGLSMDYEVFLVTHIRERFSLTGDARASIVDGLASTARVITAAALIMVAVFAAFVLSGDPVIKQFGIGMAVAVAIDATVIRCTLVPAVMSLFGDRAWALPGWVAKVLPAISVEGDAYFAKQEAAKQKG